MPRRNDITKILVIGSGPIVIGQSAEFDYSGTQACKALKAEGYEVVTASSGLEGLSILRESFFPFDLLVTDFRIPQMSSAELAWECARLAIDLRVLYVSDSCG